MWSRAMLKHVSLVILYVSVFLLADRHGASPRFALISFTNRPELAFWTWPSLHWLAQTHPGRYELFLSNRTIIPGWNASWQKLALLRRYLIMGHPKLKYQFDAVIWLDDDIMITNLKRDRLHAAMKRHFFCDRCTKAVIASRDPLRVKKHEYDPSSLILNAGLLIFKRSGFALRLIEQLFQIGIRRGLRNTRFLEQDAFTSYLLMHGNRSFAILDHGELQSFVRPGRRHWWKGHFAAHFAGMNDPPLRIRFAEHFFNYLLMEQYPQYNREALFWVGCYADDKDRDFEAVSSVRVDSKQCWDLCASRRQPFMALQDDGFCSCGSDYSTADQYVELPDERCGQACANEKTYPKRRCGGHMSNAVFFLWGKSSIPNTFRVRERSKGAYWVGCFAADSNIHADLQDGPGKHGFTTTTCATECLAPPGHSFMGLESGGHCSCGNQYLTGPQFLPVEDERCGSICKGEEQLSPSRYCGGYFFKAVYFIGRFANRYL